MNRGCQYQYQRGMHKGEYCGKPVLGYQNYCSTCLKRANLRHINRVQELERLINETNDSSEVINYINYNL